MSKRLSLVELISRRELRRLAFGESYGRGRRYFEDGRVGNLEERDGAISAEVRGTRTYHVVLQPGEELDYECSCPVGRDGLFCKHCVAVGLAWLERDRSGPDGASAVSDDEVRAYLLRQDAAALAQVILGHAAEDREFRRQLRLRAAAVRPGGIAADFIRRGIVEAAVALARLYPPDAEAAARRLRKTFEAIRMASDGGDASLAQELAGFVVERLAPLATRPRYYDSISPALCREALELHKALCRKTGCDPLRLARWLFEMLTGLGRQSAVGLTDYAPVLGAEGLAEFRRLALEAWERVPVTGPMENMSPQARREYARYGTVMAAIADFTNDWEDHVRLLERNLSNPERFLRIAGVCAAAGRHERAIEWAERGVKSFPEAFTLNLRRFLAEEYAVAGRTNDALNILWNEFSRFPLPGQYAELKRAAEQAGQWPVWRQEVVELLRDRARQERKDEPEPGRGKYDRPSGDMLILVQLGEGDVEGAWRSKRDAAMSEEVLLTLARARAKTHPLDAAIAYEELAEWQVSAKGGRRYKTATKLLLRAARLFKRAGRRAEFCDYLAGFRAKNERRRTLVRLLDSAKWP